MCLTPFFHPTVQHPPGIPKPSFSEPINNITVSKGRDITFTCVVKHLGQYKVSHRCLHQHKVELLFRLCVLEEETDMWHDFIIQHW